MKRRLLTRAVQDLMELQAYMEAENPQAAEAVAARIRKSFDLITERPEIGRPTHRPDVREWSVPGLPYVIPYRVKAGTIEILRVFHSRRRRPDEW
jgi:plasmid stabilization system protein ParE